jgi:hypothetical protein
VVRNAELQDVLYLVADGATLEMTDFLVSDTGTSKEVVPVEAIAKHLKDLDHVISQRPARRLS